MAKNFESQRKMDEYREYSANELPIGEMFTISGDGEFNVEYGESVSDIFFFDQNGEVYINSETKINGHDKLNEEDPIVEIEDSVVCSFLDVETFNRITVVDLRMSQPGIVFPKIDIESGNGPDDQEEFNYWLDSKDNAVKVDALILPGDENQDHYIYCDEKYELLAKDLMERVDAYTDEVLVKSIPSENKDSEDKVVYQTETAPETENRKDKIKKLAQKAISKIIK